ncbi:hypothetical protein HMPREF3216_01038 [Gardnerella vaginalis]|uniref:Uncharacterized protein n=1 Tax=Gardnerella vaginalis TaxID=2702 RepID=A0A133NN31_GARVA|nr:hypothetical protein HMPREF3216_01038 [Gardnerella vaginalis]
MIVEKPLVEKPLGVYSSRGFLLLKSTKIATNSVSFSRECCSNRQNQQQNREIFPENVVRNVKISNKVGER